MNDIVPTFSTPLVAGTTDAAASEPSDPLNKDMFLRLLTEQLQSQDPLDPMKNEDFVAQLARFSSLEQLFGLQDTMQAVYLGIASMNNSSMANLLGREVVADGNAVYLGETGSAELHFDADQGFSEAKVTVSDDSGRVVASFDIGGHDAGEFSVPWDGTGVDGARLPEGQYTFAIDAKNADGDSVSVQTLVVGVVDEMDYSEGTPRPSINGVSVALESIRRLTAGDAPSE